MKELVDAVTTLYTPFGSVVQLPKPTRVTKSLATLPWAVEFTVIVVPDLEAELMVLLLKVGVDWKEVFFPRKM